MGNGTRNVYVRRFNEGSSSEFPVGLPDRHTRKAQRPRRCDDNKMRAILRLLTIVIFCVCQSELKEQILPPKTRQSVKREIGNLQMLVYFFTNGETM